MLLFTCIASWPHGLEPVLVAVAAVLNATALWVASRTRSTSKAALSTLWSLPHNDRRSPASRGHNASPLVARDRRKS